MSPQKQQLLFYGWFGHEPSSKASSWCDEPILAERVKPGEEMQVGVDFLMVEYLERGLLVLSPRISDDPDRKFCNGEG